MKKKLRRIVGIVCVIFFVLSLSFQYNWANFDKEEEIQQESFPERTESEGTEQGSLVEYMIHEKDMQAMQMQTEETEHSSGENELNTAELENSSYGDEKENESSAAELENSSYGDEKENESSAAELEDSSYGDEKEEESSAAEIEDSSYADEKEEELNSIKLENSSYADEKENELDVPEKNRTELGVLNHSNYIDDTISAQSNQLQANNQVMTASDTLGQYAQISLVRRAKRITGTVPFDQNDNAGNDSGTENNIVRSFDKVLYEFELTMAMKKDSAVIKTYGGKIYVEAKIAPNNAATWNRDAFQWMQECNLSADGKVITGYYKIDDSIQSAPGLQTLNFELDVNASANDMTVQPEFTFYLEGNKAEEYQSYKDDSIIVSAVPRYNIQLEWDKGTSAYKGIEIELNGGRNKLYTVGFGFQLYGESAEKGMKGIEVPVGDLTFDVDVSLIKKVHDGSVPDKDVTNGNITFLCAKPNTKEIWREDLTNTSYKELLDEIGEYSKYSTHLPLSSGNKVFASNNRSQQIYHNGQISIEQDGNTVHVRIADYAIDGIFPYRWASSANKSEHNFTDQIGYVSVGNLFYAVALNDQTFGSQSSNCYLTFQANNMSVNSLSGIVCKKDQNETDQKLSTMHVEYKDGKMATGNYSYTLDLNDKTKSGKRLQSTFDNGDGRTMSRTTIGLITEVSLDASNPLTYAGYSMNILCKFDDECYEPVVYNDGSEYALFDKWNNYSEEITFNVLYAGKKDKSGWNSDEEMAEVPMQDLVYFDTIQQIKQNGYQCVGVMYESISGILKPGGTAKLRVPVYIKETATVDQVYQFIGNLRIWGRDNVLDRSKQTFLNPNATYPTTAFAWKPSYIKTQYDGNGVIIGGHQPGYKQGNSMIIVGGLTSITKSVTDKNADGTPKTVYDLRNLEREVSYVLYPSFVSDAEIEENLSVSDMVVIEDILPSGLMYIEGSSNYKDPTIQKQEDGTTILRWIIENWKINMNQEPITYKAEINHASINGTQYKNKVIIHAPNTDNSAEIFRTDSYSITVVNLSGHRIFKEALKEIIQPNEIAEYRINYLNITEQAVENAAILDILPYNNDNRNTAYHGTYNVLSVFPKASNSKTTYEIYGTDDETVRGSQVGDIDISDGKWKLIGKKSEEIQVNKRLTAIYIKGNFQPYEEFTMNIALDPENCEGGDWYYNDFTMKPAKESDVIQAVPVGIKVMEQKIIVTKRIKANEYYEPFGNPFFCFCLNGQLENGTQCRLYQTVEFTKQYVQEHTDTEGYVQISTEFCDLAPGIYTLTEQDVLRYYLESIDHLSENASTDQKSVTFQMDTGKAGKALFTNRIKSWDKLTHAASVINEIKKDNK
ncbi:MAG: hypothetical protein ACI4EL_04465 [Candidatus Fimimorpha sp.]